MDGPYVRLTVNAKTLKARSGSGSRSVGDTYHSKSSEVHLSNSPSPEGHRPLMNSW